ncbi:MAG: ATP-dependent RecD-like DNA helicase [Synergistaceae bacterium]|nr:ATP-dependent RecD-like DNA helicase [Synergistaceae bacterium]
MSEIKAPEDEIIRGQLERVTYANEENGYSVFKICVRTESDLVTAVGYCGKHMPGEELELSGRWAQHPKFGAQFQFSWCRLLLPSTVEGIRRYLGSGLVKGVGPKMAGRITDAFGESALDVIDENPDELLKVKGISRKLLDSIKQSWNSQKEVRSVMVFLQSNGVSPAFAAKIYAAYGEDTVQVVRENPYRLAEDIFGIGFLTADKFAAKMGVARDSPMRLDAGVRYVMSELTGEGHVCAPRSVLASRSGKLLEASIEMTDAAIGRSIEDLAMVSENIELGGERLEAVYLPAFYAYEAKSARMMAKLMEPCAEAEIIKGYAGIDAEKASRWVQDEMSVELAENQVAALKLALKSKALIITGGPGTGKTTLIRAIIGILGERGLTIKLAAPTGRAAKRMAEATGHEAMTIHRMLEPKGQVFSRNEDSPVKCDLLIIDEASMVDAPLMYHLLRATPPDSHLILVGDVHQLPSVGPGNVLRDMIASGTIPVAELNVIFRQARDSGIIVNAHRVNSGLMPVEGARRGLRDFYFVEQDDPERCVELILSLVRERIPERFGLDPVEDVQVLTPMHKGTLGASNLNALLRGELNSGEGSSMASGGRVYKTGDKVMQIRNNYEKEVYNGDIGFVRRVDADAGQLSVGFDDNEVFYVREELDELVHAYAVSIHKSQGSEYPAVVIPIHMQHFVLLQRNLLYTGITRAKELVVLVGARRALSVAVRNDDTRRRYTNLCARLRAAVA